MIIDDKPKVHTQVLKLMGNRFEISVVDKNKSKANELIKTAIVEISRIEAIFSTYKSDSITSKVNDLAGIEPVEVSDEFYNLVARSIKISEITQGAFDLSYGSLDKSLWNFDLKMTKLPSKEVAQKSIALINYKNIVLDPSQKTVFLKEKGMRLGFGGIGKGYAADQAKAILIKNGVESGIVNASGDLITWGKQPNGQPWTIGIADPNTKTPFSYFEISNMAVATSGNYEKFATIQGKRYSHTIDPKTGLPVHGIKSVTIICPSAELADAMATPIMVMGVKIGLNLINQMKGIGCLIIDEKNSIFTSKNINLKEI